MRSRSAEVSAAWFFFRVCRRLAVGSQALGKEIGFYQDPVSDYGRLNSEMLRAVRLVVDTGIHDKNWTRQQVIDYMRANDTNDALAQTEAELAHRLARASPGL